MNDFPVGPGQTYQTLGYGFLKSNLNADCLNRAVPWNTVGPGDTVRIFAKATPYLETFAIQLQGTSANWIKICGVPDPQTGAL